MRCLNCNKDALEKSEVVEEEMEILVGNVMVTLISPVIWECECGSLLPMVADLKHVSIAMYDENAIQIPKNFN